MLSGIGPADAAERARRRRAARPARGRRQPPGPPERGDHPLHRRPDDARDGRDGGERRAAADAGPRAADLQHRRVGRLLALARRARRARRAVPLRARDVRRRGADGAVRPRLLLRRVRGQAELARARVAALRRPRGQAAHPHELPRHRGGLGGPDRRHPQVPGDPRAGAAEGLRARALRGAGLGLRGGHPGARARQGAPPLPPGRHLRDGLRGGRRAARARHRRAARGGRLGDADADRAATPTRPRS